MVRRVNTFLIRRGGNEMAYFLTQAEMEAEYLPYARQDYYREAGFADEDAFADWCPYHECHESECADLPEHAPVQIETPKKCRNFNAELGF